MSNEAGYHAILRMPERTPEPSLPLPHRVRCELTKGWWLIE